MLARGGMKELMESAQLDKHAELSTHSFTEGVIRKDKEYLRVDEEIQKLSRRFVDRVYSRGLRSRIDKSQMKGMSGKFNGVELMSWTMCGRVMLTFKKGNNSITFTASEDGDPCMRLNSLYGTLPVVRDLVEQVIKVFDDPNELMPYERFKDDKGVSYCGL